MLLGVVIMVITSGLLYLLAPQMMAILTPNPDIIALGTRVLRIEAFAEPLFGASIVAGGVFQGAGSTLIPTLFNLGTMWGIRIPLAWLAAPRWGLPGVWAAMCLELCVRGILYLIRMAGKRWLPVPEAQGAAHSVSAAEDSPVSTPPEGEMAGDGMPAVKDR